MRKKRAQKNKGFSLVEFIVILTIFGIMTGVSMFNYNQHQATLLQSALAQDIALSIRQAQVYGISATDKVYGTASSDFNESSYLNTLEGGTNIITDQSVRGISININESKIVLFEDVDRDHIYDLSGDRVIDERSILSPKVGFELIDLCNGGSCADQTTGVVDITFQRPYPDAYIRYRTSLNTSSASSFDNAIIIISESANSENNSYIEVSSIGGITVKNNYEL